ncbi:hypothetical protein PAPPERLAPAPP_03680 [Brevundimonas phage vB_BpoS-Papperlapapp]|uniref:Uncharacterized protein n=1 Tax=Brevundimonas phage vB_BpoS-Domovoi TaxID=2948598 RepID=A0A9E7MRZ2_9CAUD|nr:hypothetical protein DOMOVOI_02630 [Brevundimonas phage vB_BpoS-Domovoi]USN16109.1 hypothetical protein PAPPERLAPAPP_03680 [Brevundimonas phage vB_BpoS-Papperlapapp]
MRQDFFNAPVLQPGDDLGLIWFERFGEAAEDDDVTAQFLEQDDDEGYWGCTLSGASGELEVNDFSSRGELQDWLAYHDIPLD